MTDEKILKYIKKELSPEEKKQFLDWVDESPANKEQYRQLRKLWDLAVLSDEYDADGNREAYQKIKQKIYKTQDTGESKQDRKVSRIIVEIMKVAAIVVLTLGIAWYLFSRPIPDAPVAYNNIEVPTGQRVKLSLSDGSVVWLNAGTKFTYPDKFSDTERTVILNGEAQFNVSRSDTYPFVVQTATYSVKVLGTKFNVYAYNESSKFEATLLNGTILLQKGNNVNNDVNLQPGQQAVFNKPSVTLAICRIDTTDISSWVDGYHCFNKTPFRDMVERLSHYYEKKITVKYPSILNYECTGKFRHDESLEHILNVVKISKPFKYKVIGDEVIIF